MKKYITGEIAEVVNGRLTGDKNISFSRLLIDSRNLVFPDESIFIAIKGERNDGHVYIRDLYEKGVKCFIVSSQPHEIPADTAFIIVSDTLVALQKLAAFHRSKFSYPVIGITGSNGKTVVKEWLYEILKEKKVIVRNPRSYNSQVGVPLSVWQMDESYELGIFEAGISKVGEMEKLAGIINPEIGIFTTIGPAHQENFYDLKQKVTEKLKLFIHSQKLVYCLDYPVLLETIPDFCKANNIKAFSWSRSGNADLFIEKIEKSSEKSLLTGVYKGTSQQLTVPFTDDASIENSILCWATLLSMDFSFEFISRQIQLLTPVAMRLQLNEGIHNCSIINDTYNSDFASLKIALNFLAQQNQHKTKILVLSDILQSGHNEENLYEEVSDLVNQQSLENIIGIGPAISKYGNKFKIQGHFFNNVDEFIGQLSSLNIKDSTILLKGARKFQFEKISQILHQKAHETVLEVNLNAFVHNLNQYKTLLPSGTSIMAMVKAFSYGSGLFEIANILQFEKVNYLAVAYADEGIELRQSGISIPIMVMSPEPGSFEKMIEYDLEPELYNLRVLQMFQNEAKRQGKQHMNVHIKLDTGMKRLGFEESELDLLLFKLKNNPWLKVKSVFSHLVSADDSNDDSFTFRQIDLFKTMAKKIENALKYDFLKHILNSAGVERFPNLSFDMVRMGIGLYGFCIENNFAGKLESVLSLKTVISQIKQVPANETIGYNRKGTLEKDSVIATIPVGYADGLDRRLSNGVGKFKINGKIVSVVGNICMDMCMLDITDVEAKEGDEVIVFDTVSEVQEIAKTIGTIPYEILTGISRRVKRVYYHE